MLNNIKQLKTALALAGIGLGKLSVDLNADPVPCYDTSTEATGQRIHTHINSMVWQEIGLDSVVIRWGYITHAFRITECSGTFPSISQKVVEFGRFALPNPEKPEPHSLEVRYSEMRFSFLDGVG